MSGGHFEYNQYRIQQIAEEVERLIRDNGREKTEKELEEESYSDSSWYDKYQEDLYHYKYPEEVIEEFKKGFDILKTAYVYAQRIDWLLSGDDSEETFLERLKDDLSKL